MLSTTATVTLSESSCLELAAALERFSNHPIANAFKHVEACPQVTNACNFPGQGVTAQHQRREYAVGHSAFLSSFCEQVVEVPGDLEQVVGLADRNGLLAWFELQDPLRNEARSTLASLTESGLRQELLSGDRSSAVPAVAKELRLDAWQGSCSAEDKLAYIEKLQSAGHSVIMVGDGLNDAPVLAAADCSFAVNGATDLAKSRADALLLKPDLGLLLTALEKARRTRRIVRQNITWALGYNGLAVPLAALGLVPPWAAAVGMSLSSLLVVGNSLRLGKDNG